MTAELIERAIPLLRKAGERLSSEIGDRSRLTADLRVDRTLASAPTPRDAANLSRRTPASSAL